MDRPRLVLVTGAPGSGKSTLARGLAARLRLPFVARDDVRGGLLFTAGAWADEMTHVPSGDVAVEVFLETIEGLLTNGVSCVVEYVVRTHRPQDLERLTSISDAVVVVTTCADPMRRVAERNLTDPLASQPAVLRAGGFSSIEEHTESVIERMRLVRDDMLLNFSVRSLQVDMTADPVPSLADVATFVIADC